MRHIRHLVRHRREWKMRVTPTHGCRTIRKPKLWSLLLWIFFASLLYCKENLTTLVTQFSSLDRVTVHQEKLFSSLFSILMFAIVDEGMRPILRIMGRLFHVYRLDLPIASEDLFELRLLRQICIDAESNEESCAITLCQLVTLFVSYNDITTTLWV